jgi:transposase-like protein
MTLNLKAKIYTDEASARAHLEAIQWPEGPICPHCGVINEATLLEGKSTRPGVYKCRPCQKPFSVTVGSIFERSKVPLTKWLLATELLTSSKKGISAHQIHRMLGVTYKTAWFMMHRIREAMAPVPGNADPMGGEGKIVEVDETYYGDRDGLPQAKRNKKGVATKRMVVSLVERGGKVRSFHIKGNISKEKARKVLFDNVDRQSDIVTDDHGAYPGAAANFAQHSSVNHSAGEYVRGDIHTNTIEGVFSVFKRGMVGTYQHCGEQHLQRYLNEFDFRYSNRAKLGIDDAMRAAKVLEVINGKRLTYRRINAA